MSATHHAAPDDHEDAHLHHPASLEIGERPWTLSPPGNEAATAAGPVSSPAAGLAATSGPSSASARPPPHVSLFSPGVPAIPPSHACDLPSDSTHGHAGSSASCNSSRPLSTLSAAANMTKRTNRLKVSDEQPPIVQLHTQIPRAQKDADDPTTPVDSKRSNSTMPNSRAPSYNQATGPLYLRASSEAIPLPDHLYTRGLLEGRHSDITVIAFGQRYNLHRLILDRAPFFTSALSAPWLESQSKEVTLHPEEIDHSITQAAFEMAIKKLYGVDISKECDAEAIGLFATGCWLEMQDLIDSSIESILRHMSPDLLGPLIRLVTTNYYGRSGDRILESAKAMLSRNGWEMPLRYWDGIPGDVVRELVGSDGFFVDSEWDRWVLAKRILDRRLRQAAIDAGLIQRGQKPVPKAPDTLCLMAVRFDGIYRQSALTVNQPVSDAHSEWLALYTDPDIERILVLLDEGIHYIHMDYEQLEFIRGARDVFGLPVMPDKVISNALWQQLALRQRVLSTDESAQELGLAKPAPEPVVSKPKADGKQKAVVYTPEEESEMESGSWDRNAKPRKFWIPSSDCNIVLGNGADPVVTTSSSFQRHATRLSATMQPEDAQWATDFASSPATMVNPNTRIDSSARPISAGGGNAGQPKPIAYTEFPPFRFSAEFPNPRYLKEKKRVYSRTVSYAGSLWNIYIQKVRSAKNVQLGVYLHRAKEREGEEALHGNALNQQNTGSVDERIGQLEREMLLRSERRQRRRSGRALADQAAEEETSGSGGDPDATLVSNGSRTSLFGNGSLGRRRSGAGLPHPASPRTSLGSQFQALAASPPTDGEGVDSPAFFPVTTYSASEQDSDESDDDDEHDTLYPNPSFTALTQRKSRSLSSVLPPYVDGRPTIKTYFKIYSPSKGGRMLSIYESAPDRFNFSQSWGWKSSTLMLDEVAISGGGEEGAGDGEPLPGKKGDGKLRFMVVIGNL
ncbi:hypothetical protein BS50DRAFT_33504 [Corynespora cassiicola Philippines]|uniref:BTB domain-containing protein n=1 Tax=Corynespora cassiicola Philippines TaxID=1448308 RepID=A0A2T2PBU8_CORCC|nr:hypothetical protein BS50DRAFT_33504 [Corynespora cassiicola Philippines]